MKLKDACSSEESYDKLKQHIQKQRHYFANKGPYTQSYGFSSSHVEMWELDHKEGRMPRNWCFPTLVLEKTLESHLDSKQINPINPKENQPWIFTGRTDVKAETPTLWPPDVKGCKVCQSPSRARLCDPMDCSPPGSSVQEVFQARMLEWVAISFSRGSFQPRDWTWVSCTAGRFFTDWATREELTHWKRPWCWERLKAGGQGDDRG